LEGEGDKGGGKPLTTRGKCPNFDSGASVIVKKGLLLREPARNPLLCRAKREMKDAKAIIMKNGKPATQGVCPTCGTKMFRIGKS